LSNNFLITFLDFSHIPNLSRLPFGGLFSFSGFFEKGRKPFGLKSIWGAYRAEMPGRISPAPGAIQQQPEPLDGAGRHKIHGMQAVHAMQTHFDRIDMNGKVNATK
jgi:hypothetical protein